MAKLSQITIGGTSYLLNADRLRKDSIPTGWSTNVPVYFDPTDGKPHLITTTLPTSLIPGSVDEVLGHLAQVFFDDANMQIDAAVDRVEPTLAAFLTIAVGATLIAVMLPLIGIMGSIA